MKVLFVCTGNTCRSPMAEAILKGIAVKRGMNLHVSSAGILTVDGLKASGNAERVIMEKGYDLSGFKSSELNGLLLNDSDLVLTMTEAHKDHILSVYSLDKVFTLAEYVGEYGDVSDPYGGDISIYRDSADDLEEKIIKLAELLSNNISRR